MKREIEKKELIRSNSLIQFHKIKNFGQFEEEGEMKTEAPENKKNELSAPVKKADQKEAKTETAEKVLVEFAGEVETSGNNTSEHTVAAVTVVVC